jgi:phasin family protein
MANKAKAQKPRTVRAASSRRSSELGGRDDRQSNSTQAESKGPDMNANFAPNLENATSAARDQFEKASQSAYRSYDEFSKFQRENWEAFVAASQIFAKGAEGISKAWMSFTQDAVESAAAASKALIGAKTLREVVDVQNDFAKGSFDKFVAESTKLSEATVKVVNEAAEPLTARLNLAAEKMFKPVAL